MSGFVAAQAPTGDYGLDIAVEGGLLSLDGGTLLAGVQELFVAPVWTALVWCVHALLVVLEWAFTIDLLDGARTVLSASLRHTEEGVTRPWLGTVLALAAIGVAYQGVMHRRVLQTTGEVAAMATMMAAGMWIVADPAGTIGLLSRWVNAAGLGTLSVTAGGPPALGARVLGASSSGVFAQAVEAPWCYLEFGDVEWCRQPSRMDPALRAAGRHLAARELSELPPGEGAEQVRHSAELLDEATSNGALFLALPANSKGRNWAGVPWSLMRALCRGPEASSCHGPTAAQAEFRTQSGTWPRVAGLLLIAIGLVGMLLLVGFIVLRLLSAALLSLLLLLLAPGMVLAPAFGEAGRAVFRRWLLGLLGAVLSKLLFAFLLGAVFAVASLLAGLQALGWWTQWLLVAAFWWSAFVRRHAILSVASAPSAGVLRRERPLARGVAANVGPPHRAAAALRRSWARRLPAPAAPMRAGAPVRAPVAAGDDEQAHRLLAHDARDAAMQRSGPDADVAALSARLQRLRIARGQAAGAGEARRGHSLALREREVENKLAERRVRLQAAHEAERAARRPGGAPERARLLRERAEFLDRQAAIPGALHAARTHAGQRRDYAALVALGSQPDQDYGDLPPDRQRSLRLQIDRELMERAGPIAPERLAARSVAREQPEPDEHPVMRDLREYMEGRKEEIGWGDP